MPTAESSSERLYSDPVNMSRQYSLRFAQERLTGIHLSPVLAVASVRRSSVVTKSRPLTFATTFKSRNISSTLKVAQVSGSVKEAGYHAFRKSCFKLVVLSEREQAQNRYRIS